MVPVIWPVLTALAAAAIFDAALRPSASPDFAPAFVAPLNAPAAAPLMAPPGFTQTAIAVCRLHSKTSKMYPAPVLMGEALLADYYRPIEVTAIMQAFLDRMIRPVFFLVVVHSAVWRNAGIRCIHFDRKFLCQLGHRVCRARIIIHRNECLARIFALVTVVLTVYSVLMAAVFVQGHFMGANGHGDGAYER